MRAVEQVSDTGMSCDKSVLVAGFSRVPISHLSGSSDILCGSKGSPFSVGLSVNLTKSISPISRE